MRSLLQLFRSIRHTRQHQLWHRLRLSIKRRILVRWAPVARRRLPTASPALQLDPPSVMTPPRGHLLRQSEPDHPVVCMLNQEVPLQTPIAWRDPDFSVCQELGRLALHYLEFLETADDRLFSASVDDWIKHNPPYQPTYWSHNWNSYGLSIRCVVLMQQTTQRRDRLDPQFLARLNHSLFAQLSFLSTNLELDLGGNHLLKNIKALLWGAAYFTGAAAHRWERTAIKILRQQLHEQVLSDGWHDERSPSYHIQVFVDLCECYQVIRERETELAAQIADRLNKMAQVIADTTHPDGGPSLFNDAGLHSSWSPQQALDLFEQLTNQRPIPQHQFSYPAAGYYGARTPSDLLLVDCGPIAPDHLPAHGHGDILAMEWSIGGHRVFVDHGVYEYGAGEWRDRSRSTRSHNTVTVEDADQCEFYASFRVGRRARILSAQYARQPEGFRLEGSHDGFTNLSGSPIHQRKIGWQADLLEVADQITGGNGQAVRSRLLCHPDCAVQVHRSGGASISIGSVIVELRTDHQVHVQPFTWCPDFGVKIPTLQLVIEYGAAPCTGQFELVVTQRTNAGGPDQ